MDLSHLSLPFPEQPLLSFLLLFLVTSCLLYFARRPAHYFITSLSRVVHEALGMASTSLKGATSRIAARNREVLLAQGREASEHIIEREFTRVDAALQRDMAEYPALQRRLAEVITNIDEDYQHSSEVPPSPPGWTKAVAAVAKIPSTEDPMVVEILRGINDALVKAHDKAVTEYRNATRGRHALLKTMAPDWRKLRQTLEAMGKRVDGLMARSKTIDRHMDEYESIMKGTDKALRSLSSSAFTQFFIAGFVLAVAIGGAVVNFNLITRPMQEMVGGGSYLLGFKTANIAALVIILVEAAMGLFLMESLRITRLFPTIGALDDKMRRRMIGVTFIILLSLASIEAGLAYMRDLLSQDDAALVANLLNGSQTSALAAGNRWITTAAQMGMGFILPFALTFIAIPLETFVHTSRTVIGTLTTGLLNTLAGTLHVLGKGAEHGSKALINLYDLVIFAPLWIELRFTSRRSTAAASPAEAGDVAGAKAIASPARQDVSEHDKEHAEKDGAMELPHRAWGVSS
ncbi:MAG: hypothetical protein P8173_10710 [Gammaproteobacteria bacterium]